MNTANRRENSISNIPSNESDDQHPSPAKKRRMRSTSQNASPPNRSKREPSRHNKYDSNHDSGDYGDSAATSTFKLLRSLVQRGIDMATQEMQAREAVQTQKYNISPSQITSTDKIRPPVADQQLSSTHIGPRCPNIIPQ